MKNSYTPRRIARRGGRRRVSVFGDNQKSLRSTLTTAGPPNKPLLFIKLFDSRVHTVGCPQPSPDSLSGSATANQAPRITTGWSRYSTRTEAKLAPMEENAKKTRSWQEKCEESNKRNQASIGQNIKNIYDLSELQRTPDRGET